MKMKFSTGLYSYCRSNEDTKMSPFGQQSNQLYWISSMPEGVHCVVYLKDYSHACRKLDQTVWRAVNKLERSCKRCKWGLKIILTRRCYKKYEPL